MPKKKKTQARSEPFLGQPRQKFDKGAFVIGAVASAFLVTIAFALFYASQIPPSQSMPLPSAQQQGKVVLPPVAPNQTGQPQLVAKNGGKTPLQVSTVTVGNKSYNINGVLQPGQSITINYTAPSSNQGPQGSGGSQGTPGGSQQNQSGGTAVGPLAISTDSLAPARQDQAYSFALEAEGGTGTYSWAADGLPSGLRISSSGLISGAALKSGTFSISFTVSDGASSVSAELPLVVTQ